ncbi:hypothetical protein HIV01_017725 [Lysobacter arenosi]|uniref:Uncharacterized protein n=1 Tax=Lysobacter arenosi TaxID=2795387 RepID=A0ABX7RB23_9GAMM|nr:hypothetical protein [Lysobacter arenosi]QSX74950.1 hypothetical protein HIV01_017725 [Lysobacter arenosi]
MPDADRPRIPMPGDPMPGNWNEAFAALPIESPGTDGWQRLTRALDGAAADATARPRPSMRRRNRWPMWLAAAAAVSAVALVPVLRDQDGSPVSTGPAQIAVAPSPSASSPTPAATPATTLVTTPSSGSTAVPEVAIATTQPAERNVAKRKPTGTPTRKPAPAASPLPGRNDNATRVASSDATATTPDLTAAALANRAAEIQSLQAESAQLEALVALARDSRVSSASGAALGVELDERIGRIDASLSQPGLADSERAVLWQQRVTTMRALAEVETTQRWLVSHGERYDGALVSVD